MFVFGIVEALAQVRDFLLQDSYCSSIRLPHLELHRVYHRVIRHGETQHVGTGRQYLGALVEAADKGVPRWPIG